MKNVLLGVAVLFSAYLAQANEQAGEFYKEGVAVYKTNPVRAYELFVLAAEMGHPVAMVGAGQCCETGSGTATNYAAAIEWYEKAVEHNSLKACEGLARIYASCSDPEFHDGQKAVKYATPVARKKPRDAEKLAQLAAAHARNFEFSKAIKMSKKSCEVAPLEKGDERKRQHKEYLLGAPFPAAATEAWLMEAANRDSVWAMSQLADRYADIDGSMYDLASARLWRERAAKKGSQRDDLFQIGCYCVYGIGGSAEVEKGMQYLEKAAERGSEQANAELGNIYLAGTKVPRNTDKAFKHYSLMEHVDDEIIAYRIDVLRSDKTRHFLRDIKPADLHKMGRRACAPQKGSKGKDPSYRRALVYYLMAAEQGCVPAMQSAANLCFNGGRFERSRLSINSLAEPALRESLLKSTEMDETKPYPKEAAKWYFELAKLGEPDFPTRTHESFAEMAKWYNELARQDGSVPMLDLD